MPESLRALINSHKYYLKAFISVRQHFINILSTLTDWRDIDLILLRPNSLNLITAITQTPPRLCSEKPYISR